MVVIFYLVSHIICLIAIAIARLRLRLRVMGGILNGGGWGEGGIGIVSRG